MPVHTQPLAAHLWTANQDLAHAALQHPFVRGLGDGSLPIASFRAYVAQDAFFLDAFARAYALALARSPDRHGLEAFHSLIGGVLDELRLHAGYAADWQVELTRIEPDLATLAYTDFLLATASLGTVGETCAAMTPCMRLYAFLGQSLAADGADRPDNPYRAWIQTYAAAEFEQLAVQLESLLDRYAPNASDTFDNPDVSDVSQVSDVAHASDIHAGADLTPRIRAAYRRALQLELAFFDAHLPHAEPPKVR